MLKAPPSRKLASIFGKTVTLTQYLGTGDEDAFGQKNMTVLGTYRIKAEVQEITSYDLSFLVPGIADVGDAWGFFLPSYKIKGKTLNLQPEDEITWNSKTWRIDKIEDFYVGESLWYRKALMRRKL